MTAHLERNDPAGYASASLLAFVDFAASTPDTRRSRDIGILLPGLVTDPLLGNRAVLKEAVALRRR